MQDSSAHSLSIVIPVHNQVAYTQACLKALHASPPHINHEIIVVDDGSDDGTPQVLAQRAVATSRIRTIRNECAQGFAAACNRGAAVASGSLLLFLNNDTEVQPGWFSPLYALITARDDIGIVAPKLLLPDGTVQHCGKVWSDPGLPHSHPHHIYYRFPSTHPAVNKSRTYMMVTGACILIRAADFRSVGCFDERYENGWEDDDLCYALASIGKRIYYCAESVVIHHQNRTLNERMDELQSKLPGAGRLRELDDLLTKGVATTEQIQLARQVHATFQDMEAELLRLRCRFDRNRTLFFGKWGAVVKRDDYIFCQKDGVPLNEALSDATPAELALPAEISKLQTDDNPGGNSMPLVSIIILTRNRMDVTKACIASIQRHTSESHEIIFIDNGSTDGTLDWLKELVAGTAEYRLIENNDNLGFSAGCNQGIRAARGNFILLLNNDVVVTPEWLAGLLECFDGEEVGIVGPMTNNISGPQRWPWPSYRSMDELDDFSREFRRSKRYQRRAVRRVVGFCMLFRRELVERIGLLDEQFGSGNFEDDDYCLRAALEGLQNTIAVDVFIHHVGSATFQGNNIDYHEALLRNQQLFNRKWSKTVTDESLAHQVIRVKTLEKAVNLNQRGFADEAVELLLNQGIRQLPGEPLFYHVLAQFFFDAGMFRDALAILNECPVALPVSARNVQVRAKLELGQVDEAERIVKNILKSAGEQGDIMLLQGYVMLAKGELLAAANVFEQFCSRRPSHALGFLGFSEVARLSGDESVAVLLLERAFRLDPADIGVAQRYHASIVCQDQLVAAERAVAEARHFYPDSDTLAYIHIDLLLRLERFQDAMAVVEHVLVTCKWGEGFLDAAQAVRDRLGPVTVSREREREGGTISLCMIVKNEEKNLPRCLRSLLPVVDELVIADTGSIDRTCEIAAIFGARVIRIPWTDDYSAARNASLNEARGEWILAMDADEVISAQDYDTIRSLVRSSPSGNVAFSVVSRNYTNRVDLETWRANRGEYPLEEVGRGWMPSEKTRLFPNQASLRFENPLHEMVEPSLERQGIPTLSAPFVVHHYGYLDDERQQRKLQHYYELGKRKLVETGGSPKAIVELAIQAAGVKKYEEAMSLWQSALRIDPASPLAHFNLGHVCLQMGMFKEGRDAAKRAMELKQDYREAQVNYLLCQLCLGNIGEALAEVERFLAHNPDYPLLVLMRGILWAANGDGDKALHEFRGLLDNHVEFSRYIHDVTGKLLQAGQQTFAEKLVAVSRKAGSCSAETLLLMNGKKTE